VGRIASSRSRISSPVGTCSYPQDGPCQLRPAPSVSSRMMILVVNLSLGPVRYAAGREQSRPLLSPRPLTGNWRGIGELSSGREKEMTLSPCRLSSCLIASLAAEESVLRLRRDQVCWYNFDERLGIAVVHFDRFEGHRPPTKVDSDWRSFRRGLHFECATRDWCCIWQVLTGNG